MIPKLLTIQGIYSYQEKQIIEFENLLAGQLFGIFGPVGSGKSTILEAISFALYGETERLNQRDNRNYNMMNLKSDDLLIDFIFQTGKEAKEYRFTVSGKRSNKRFEDVRTFNRSAYQKKNGEWEPLEKTDAKEILGLSYDNFRRTIIIPQGKFQEFLQLGDKARTQMLKEIFQLNKFDLYNKVRALEIKNNEKKENIEGGLGQLGEANEAIITKKEQELSNCNAALEKAETHFREKQKEEKEQDKLKELFDQITKLKANLEDLQQQEKAYQEKEMHLKKFEYCQLNFKEQLNRESELENEIKEEKKKIAEKKKEFSQVSDDLKKYKEKFKAVKEEFNNREQYRQFSEELNKILEVRAMHEEITGLQKRLKEGENFVQKKEQALKETQNQNQSLSRKLKEKKNSLPDIQLLSSIQQWFTNKRHIEQNRQKAESEVTETEKAIKILEEEKTAWLTEEIIELVGDDIRELKISQLLPRLTKAIKASETELEKLINEEKHLLAEEKMEAIATELKDGMPCPVCGAKEHPNILSIENVKEALEKTRVQILTLKKENGLLSTTIGELKHLNYKIEDKEKTLKKHLETLQNQNDKAVVHLKHFKWNEYSPEEEEKVNVDFEKAKKLGIEIKSDEKELEQLQQDLEKQRELKEKAKQKIESLKGEHQSKSIRSETLLDQLRTLNFEDYHQQTAEEIKRQDKALAQKIETIEKEHSKLEKDISELNDREKILSGQIQSAEEALDKGEKALEKLNKTIHEALSNSEFKSVEAVKVILEAEIEVEEERKDIQAYNQKLHTAKDNVNSLSIQMKDKSFDEKRYKILKEEIQSLKANVEEQKKEVIRAEEAVKQLKKEWKKKQALQKELEQIKERAADIKILKNLFKGSGFVNYISSVYLDNLCKAANERFYKLTRQKLRLEITDTNNFQVRDFLNNGQVRSVKTLSGGQTFQASLSLALALAESIQKQNQTKENFFFLDEGFGSQDKESLHVVFDTLKSLRKEDRVVGVISHVEELQQEIDVFLDIYNDEEKGSRISESWS
jgi:exonuclease SbcC